MAGANGIARGDLDLLDGAGLVGGDVEGTVIALVSA
jgi:hypothetical protein